MESPGWNKNSCSRTIGNTDSVNSKRMKPSRIEYGLAKGNGWPLIRNLQQLEEISFLGRTRELDLFAPFADFSIGVHYASHGLQQPGLPGSGGYLAVEEFRR